MNDIVLSFYSKLLSQLSDGVKLPANFKIMPDGTLIFENEATVWNDQITNKISPDANIVSYYLAETTCESPTAYGVYKDKVWVRGTFKPNETITYTFVKDESGASKNEDVFLLYDDFNTLDESKWNYTNSSVSSSILSVNGGNQVVGATTNFAIPPDVIIEWNMYTKKYDFDSGIRVGAIYFISDRGNYNHTISTSWTYPSGSQQANTWNDYQVILRSNSQTFTNLTVNKTVTNNYSYSPSSLSFICDSDTSLNPLKVDYICIRKYYDISQINVVTTQIDDITYKVEITNNGNATLEDVEVQIDDLPTDYYKVTVKSVSPVLEAYAFPSGIESSISFFTQFDHGPKYNSECAFHIHCYIPPDATVGQVKLQLIWQKLPVEIIVQDTGYNTVRQVNKQLNTITKVFTITEDMKGRHVLLDFGLIDTVHSLSQIVFHKLIRLGSDIDDTWPFDLPILYVDWHVEKDMLGSKDQFIKY